jgi:hypothetical protein
VSLEESRQAFERVKELYRALGLELGLEFHPVLICKEESLK